MKIDAGSNPFYLAFVVENVNGYGDLDRVELLPSKRGASWLPMRRSWGVTWSVDLNANGGTPPPYSLRITGPENSTSVVALNLIPNGWKNGEYYYSRVNFS